MNLEFISGEHIETVKCLLKYLIKLLACCLNLNFSTKGLEYTSYNL